MGYWDKCDLPIYDDFATVCFIGAFVSILMAVLWMVWGSWDGGIVWWALCVLCIIIGSSVRNKGGDRDGDN